MIEWDSINTVLLDMDGTLLDLHFDNYFWSQHLPARYAQIHAQDEAHSRQLLTRHMARERGSLNWYSVDYWSEQLQLDIPSLKREIQHLIQVRPHVEEFLLQLRDAGKHVLLVTNAHHKSLEIKLARTDIGRWFDHVVVSHEFRLPKENPQFWHALHARHPFNANKTLLIDDTETVLKSAHTYGIAHLMTLLQPDSKLQKRLDTHFPGIHHFDEIMPVHTATEGPGPGPHSPTRRG